MSIKSALSALFNDEKKKAESFIEHPTLTSSRLWFALGFVALLIWFTKGVLTEQNMMLCFWVFVIYTVANTATRIAQIFVNGSLQKTKMQLEAKGLKPTTSASVDGLVP